MSESVGMVDMVKCWIPQNDGVYHTERLNASTQPQVSTDSSHISSAHDMTEVRLTGRESEVVIEERLVQTRHAQLVQRHALEEHCDLTTSQPVASRQASCRRTEACRVAGGEEDEPRAVGDAEALDAQRGGDARLHDLGGDVDFRRRGRWRWRGW